LCVECWIFSASALAVGGASENREIVDNHKTSAKLFNAQMMRTNKKPTTWPCSRAGNIWRPFMRTENMAINTALA
jgi:hypothetical protein